MEKFEDGSGLVLKNTHIHSFLAGLFKKILKLTSIFSYDFSGPQIFISFGQEEYPIFGTHRTWDYSVCQWDHQLWWKKFNKVLGEILPRVGLYSIHFSKETLKPAEIDQPSKKSIHSFREIPKIRNFFSLWICTTLRKWEEIFGG